MFEKIYRVDSAWAYYLEHHSQSNSYRRRYYFAISVSAMRKFWRKQGFTIQKTTRGVLVVVTDRISDVRFWLLIGKQKNFQFKGEIEVIDQRMECLLGRARTNKNVKVSDRVLEGRENSL